MRFGLLTAVVVCAMAAPAAAEPTTYPEARIARPLTLPGRTLELGAALRFDDGLSHDYTAVQLRWGVTDRIELLGAVDSDSTEIGAAYAFDDGRGIASTAFAIRTSFRDIPLIAGFHTRVRLGDVWMRTLPSQLVVLHGSSETDVIGRLPLGFGIQAAPRLALELQLTAFEYSRALGSRFAFVDQLELRTVAWLSHRVFARSVLDLGVAVDADPLHGSASDLRYWLVLYAMMDWRRP